MKKKNLSLILILGAVLILAIFAGCTTQYPTSNPPKVKITQPQNNAVLTLKNVTITVQVSNFTLVNQLGGPAVSGKGHIHYFFDVDPPTTPGQPAVTAAGTYVATIDTSNTWRNVPDGVHTFSVELVNNDHTPLNPPVTSTIQVTVQTATPGQPQVTITQPLTSQTPPAGDITVSVDVSNFDLVDKLGQSNVAGEGHLHYFLDVTPPTTPGQPAITTPGTYAPTINTSFTWKNITAGQHTFSVELVNNDHTPLQPPVTTSVTVTVTSPGGGGQTVNVYLKAQNFAFNLSTITVPAGATVVVHFKNDDSYIPHNFAVYTNSAATTVIFQGQQINGVASTTYTFTAPSTPGNYFFRCDVHPTMMTGTFIVQ